MKNYALDKSKKMEFITHYDIDDSSITVHFASGNTWEIANDIEHKNAIIKKMREQVDDAKRKTIKIDKKISFIRNLIGCALITSIVNTIFILLASPISFILEGTLYLSMTSLLASLPFIAHNISEKREIEKMTIFLENEIVIKSFLLGNQRQNIISGISKKAKKAIDSKPQNRTEALTINDLHNNKITLNDLKVIKSNIDTMTKLGFAEEAFQPTLSTEEQGTARTYKK